jgi:hypothetical protein
MSSPKTPIQSTLSNAVSVVSALFAALFASVGSLSTAAAQHAEGGGHQAGGEANLVLPNFADISMMGVDGRTLLMSGLVVSALGVVFAIAIYSQMPRRHRRQLRRRVVRHPREHLRQLAHRLRQRSAASPSRPTPSRSRPA